MSMAVCDMEESKVNYTAEEIDALLNSGALKRLGMGARRSCYALPGGRRCVKCYRSDDEIAEGKHPGQEPYRPVAASVAQEICRCRFDEKRNTCCQEFRYWEELRESLPEDLMSVFPAVMELFLLPSRGWCVVEELVANADGSPAAKFHEAWLSVDVSMREKLLAAFDALVESLIRHAVRVYDPQNILVQNGAGGDIRLRITDFEPVTRAFIPLDRISSAIVRMKIRRRISRYRRQFRIMWTSLLHNPDADERNEFLFVIWSAARSKERQILEEIGRRFKILRTFEVAWPRRHFTRNLSVFYGIKGWFRWWNKARKCGRGPFLVIVVEDPAPVWRQARDTSGRVLLCDGNIYDAKMDFRRMTGHSNRVHSSVTAKETKRQLFALAALGGEGRPISFGPMRQGIPLKCFSRDKRHRRWDELIAVEGAKLGLSDCRPFLEKKLVNDVFYEGMFKGRPCIVKCSSRAPESIVNEYTLGKRLHAQAPELFPEFYACHAGPLAFVVMEKIEGGRSLESEPGEKYGDDILAILDALYACDVIHRDILPSNFLVAPDGHLKLIDFQFSVDMKTRWIDPWLMRRPEYHFAVFAAAMGPNGAWWDDAAFVDFLFPFLRERVRSRIGRLRLEIPFTPYVRLRLVLFAMRLRVQRMFTRKGSR